MSRVIKGIDIESIPKEKRKFSHSPLTDHIGIMPIKEYFYTGNVYHCYWTGEDKEDGVTKQMLVTFKDEPYYAFEKKTSYKKEEKALSVAKSTGKKILRFQNGAELSITEDNSKKGG